MRLYQPSFLLSFAATVIATPVPIPVAPAAECKAVQLVVSVLQLAKATPFCSSFLKIPVSTSTSTATSYSTFTKTTNIPEATNTVFTTTVVDEITNTLVTGTSTDYVATITDISSTTSVTTFYSTSTVTATYGANAKRAGANEVEPRAGIVIPPYLAAFASSEISSACSCLAIPTSVVKSTVTMTLDVSTTQTAYFTSSVSTGTTTTTTSTQDIEAVITSTASTTTTDTIPSTTTIGVLATTYVDPTATQTFRLRCEGTGDDLYDGGHFISFDTQIIANIGYSGDDFALGAQGQLFLASDPDQLVGTFAGSPYVRIFSGSTGGFTPMTCSIADSLLSCQSNDGNGNVLDIANDGSAAGSLQMENSVSSNSFPASIYVDPA